MADDPTDPNLLEKFGIVLSPEPSRRAKQTNMPLSDSVLGRQEPKGKEKASAVVAIVRSSDSLNDSFSKAISEVKLDKSKTKGNSGEEEGPEIKGLDPQSEIAPCLYLGDSPKSSTNELNETFETLLQRYNLGGPFVPPKPDRSRSNSASYAQDAQAFESSKGEYKIELETEALAVAYRQALEALLEDHGLNRDDIMVQKAPTGSGSLGSFEQTAESFNDLKKTQEEKLAEVQKTLHKTTETMLNSVNEAVGGPLYHKVKNYSDMNPGELLYEKGVLKENIKRVELELGALQEEECPYRPYITPRAHSMKRSLPVFARVPGEIEHKKRYISQLKTDFDEQDLKECTFKPKLNDTSIEFKNGYTGYLSALARSNARREENKKRLQEEREREFLKEATFKPKIGTYHLTWSNKNNTKKWGNVFDRLDRSVHARHDHLRKLNEENINRIYYDPIEKRQMFIPKVNKDKRAYQYIEKTGRSDVRVHDQLYYHGVNALRKRQELEAHYGEYCYNLSSTSKVCTKSEKMLRSKIAREIKSSLQKTQTQVKNFLTKEELGNALDSMGFSLSNGDTDGTNTDVVTLDFLFKVIQDKGKNNSGQSNQNEREPSVSLKHVFLFLLYAWGKGNPTQKLNYDRVKEGYQVPKINSTKWNQTFKTEDIDFCAWKVRELIVNSNMYKNVRMVQKPPTKDFYGPDVYPFTPKTCQTRTAKFLTRNRGTKEYLKNLPNFLYADHWEWERKREKALAEKEDHETDGCTFNPELTIKRKYTNVKSHFNQEEYDMKVTHFCDHRTTSEKALDKCTFAPEIHELNENVFKEQDRPWGFHEAIQRTFKGRELAAEKERLRNSSGVTRKFPRHEQIPFHLETDVRRRKADLKKQEIGNDANFILFHANVKFGHRQAIKVPIHPNDDPAKIAQDFVKIQGLRPELVQPLAEAIADDIRKWCEQYNPRHQKDRFLADLGTHIIPLEEEYVKETFKEIEPPEVEIADQVTTAWSKINSIMKSLADEEAVDKKYKELLDCEVRIQKFREDDEKERQRQIRLKEKRRQLMLNQDYQLSNEKLGKAISDVEETENEEESDVNDNAWGIHESDSVIDYVFKDAQDVPVSSSGVDDNETFATLESLNQIWDEDSVIEEETHSNFAAEKDSFANTGAEKEEAFTVQSEVSYKEQSDYQHLSSSTKEDGRVKQLQETKLGARAISEEIDYHLFSDNEFDSESDIVSPLQTGACTGEASGKTAFDSETDNTSFDGRFEDDTDGSEIYKRGRRGYDSEDTVDSYGYGEIRMMKSELLESDDESMQWIKDLNVAPETKATIAKAEMEAKEASREAPDKKMIVEKKTPTQHLRVQHKSQESMAGSTFEDAEIEDIANLIDKAYLEAPKIGGSVTSMASTKSSCTTNESLRSLDNTVPVFDLSNDEDWQGERPSRVLFELREMNKSGNYADLNEKVARMKEYLYIAPIETITKEQKTRIKYEVKGRFIREYAALSSAISVEWNGTEEESGLSPCIGNGFSIESDKTLGSLQANVYLMRPNGSKKLLGSVEGSPTNRVLLRLESQGYQSTPQPS
eukprot:Nk52_evm30s1401 gene=Nk52_evmTU30s1401